MIGVSQIRCGVTSLEAGRGGDADEKRTDEDERKDAMNTTDDDQQRPDGADAVPHGQCRAPTVSQCDARERKGQERGADNAGGLGEPGRGLAVGDRRGQEGTGGK